MAVPLRISIANHIDTAVLSASSTTGALTPGKLASDDIEDIWQASASSAWVLADLMTAKEVGAVALVNSNATPSDAVQVRVSSSDATGAAGDLYNSGSVLAGVAVKKRMLVHFLPAPVSGRYVRVDLAQSSAPSAGRWFVGRVWTPSRNISYGWEPIWRDWSEATRSRGLNLIRDRRARQRGYTFTLNGLTKQEIDEEVETLNADHGTSSDILTCLDTAAAATKTVWGPMAVTIRSTQRAPNLFTADFTVWNRL